MRSLISKLFNFVVRNGKYYQIALIISIAVASASLGYAYGANQVQAMVTAGACILFAAIDLVLLKRYEPVKVHIIHVPVEPSYEEEDYEEEDYSDEH